MKLNLLLLCAFVAGLALLSDVARADSISIQNPSFEITNPLNQSCGVGCAFNGGAMPGWTGVGSLGSFQPSSVFFNLPLPDGNIVAYSNGGSISQTLGVSLDPNSMYTLSVFVGNRLDNRNTDYSISLLAGSTTLCSFSASNASITPGSFTDETCTFQSGSTLATGNLSIVLSATGVQGDFDNVSLTEVSTVSTPEPSSLALLATGFLCVGLLFARLNRKQRLQQLRAS